MPQNYYSYAQGSMIYIKFTAQSFDLTFNNPIGVNFHANTLRNNTHIQILGLDHTFTGSLIKVDSENPEARFGFSQNLVQDNVFLG